MTIDGLVQTNGRLISLTTNHFSCSISVGKIMCPGSLDIKEGIMDHSCKYPWEETFVRLRSDGWKFCCKTTYNTHEENITRVNNVKESFLEQKKHPACGSCWREEALGGTSFRISDGAATTITQLRTNPPAPGIVDIDFGDTCNMHCIICNEYSSTVWQSMTKKYPFTEDLFDVSWNKLSAFIVENQHTLHHINLHGGEPSVDPGFNKIVDSILKIGLTNAINLRIITNGNYSENFKTKFESNIDKLKANTPLNLNLTFSLDAVGKEGEFIRGGLNFEKFASNLKAMILREVDVTISISISMLNIENHIDILHWLDQEGLGDKVKLKINMVNRPEMFSVANFGNSIHQFLPKWPGELKGHWLTYSKQFEEFIGPQVTTSHQPNKIMIQKLLDWITKYNQLAKVQSLPPYYQNFVVRLQALV